MLPECLFRDLPRKGHPEEQSSNEPVRDVAAGVLGDGLENFVDLRGLDLHAEAAVVDLEHGVVRCVRR